MYYILGTEFSILLSDELPCFESEFGLCKMREIYNNHSDGHGFPYRANYNKPEDRYPV